MKLLVFFLAFFGALSLSGCADLIGDSDIMSKDYASFNDASSNGGFASGWLPKAMPQSATYIKETHNVDTNALWVTFRYAGDDIRELTQECIPVSTVLLPNAKQVRKNVPWWPKELTNVNDGKTRVNFLVLLCPNSQHAKSTFPAYIAIDEKHQEAWYWLADAAPTPE